MAIIGGYALFLIESVLPAVLSRRNMLSISRMSIGWDIDDLTKHLDKLGLSYDKDMVNKIRAMNSRYSGKEFFRLLGFEDYEDLDFDPSEGASIIHDMNTPVPKDLHDRFDFVFENGSIEHIFDIKTAISNIAHMVKVGGVVSHGSPLDAFNHGFYNFSINFFNDFYRANGFTDLTFFIVRYASDWQINQRVHVEAIPYTHEEFYFKPEVYQSPLDKAYIACLARKIEHVAVIRTPTQAAYDHKLNLSSRLKTR